MTAVASAQEEAKKSHSQAGTGADTACGLRLAACARSKAPAIASAISAANSGTPRSNAKAYTADQAPRPNAAATGIRKAPPMRADKPAPERTIARAARIN